MFADTFQRVQSSSMIEYVFNGLERIFEYRDIVLSTPPFFNLPIIFYDITKALFRCCSSACRKKKDADLLHHPTEEIPRSVSHTINSGASTVMKAQHDCVTERLRMRAEQEAKLERNNRDGTMLVDAYIKKEDQLAADTPQDIAQHVLHGFAEAERQRDEELLAIRRMVGSLEKHLGEVERRLHFPTGCRVIHETHGIGTVIEHLADGRTHVKFDNGGKPEGHRYKPISMHKIRSLPHGFDEKSKERPPAPTPPKDAVENEIAAAEAKARQEAEKEAEKQAKGADLIGLIVADEKATQRRRRHRTTYKKPQSDVSPTQPAAAPTGAGTAGAMAGPVSAAVETASGLVAAAREGVGRVAARVTSL